MGTVLACLSVHHLRCHGQIPPAGVHRDDVERCPELQRAMAGAAFTTAEGYVWEKAREGDFCRVQYSQTNHLHVVRLPFRCCSAPPSSLASDVDAAAFFGWFFLCLFIHVGVMTSGSLVPVYNGCCTRQWGQVATQSRCHLSASAVAVAGGGGWPTCTGTGPGPADPNTPDVPDWRRRTDRPS